TSPPPDYNFAEIPLVSSRHPLWEGGAAPALPLPAVAPPAPAVGALTLAGALGRTPPITSGRDTRPDEVLDVPAETVVPLVLAIGLAVFFFGLLIDASVVGVLGVLLAIVALLRWV